MNAFFVLLVVVIANICRGLHDNSCNVVPKDPYIEMGSTAKIVCQTSCVRGEIFWTLNSRPINKSLSETINSTHTVLLLKNFTHHSATLDCRSAQTQQVVGGTIIRTYSKPGNISCLLYYRDLSATGMDQDFTCTWEHQADSTVKINYTLFLVLSSGSQIEICRSTVKTCTSESHVTEIWHDKSSVIVKATTVGWEADSDPYELNPMHILKLNYPSVKVTVFSDHLLVTWTPRPFMNLTKYNCQVKYYKTSLFNEETPKVLNTSQIFEMKLNVTNKEVESCMNYTVSVRCAIDTAPWSDWSQETTVLTKLNMKHVRTRLWRKVAELGKNGKRKVHVMWEDIPPTCEETFYYTVKHAPYDADMTGENSNYTCGNTACNVVLDQHAHRVNLIVSRNDAVIAEDSVYVPATEESLFRVTDIQASSHEGNIVVSWKAPDQPVSGYMIDWTHNGHEYYWKESKFTNATLFDLLDKTPYNVTITPLLDNRTGHGTEAPQICLSNGDPGKVAISDVIIYDKSALVRWSLMPHDACSAAVIHYKVFYHAQTGPPLNVMVDGEMDSVLLKDLNPNTEYRLYVEAISHIRNTTKSKDMFFTTKRFDPRLIVGLSVFGTIIILLVLSLGSYCVNQWKKFREKLVPNPGLSSVGTWLPPSQQKGVYVQPFSEPSKDHYDQVYTEDTLSASTPSLAADCNGNADRDRYTEVFSYTTVTPLPEVKDDKVAEPPETLNSSCPGESTIFLFAESTLVSPYRSQAFLETPVPKTGKQSKCHLGKKQEKIITKTVYVSLDMFEQDDVR
ncbi:interleukin-31 receptor subunit alpha-like isoform X2 [Melanotaenia boesemani]|uniref:interleukin-31 receptor subunit alpha-like isoform X2 n=1 Tax=Melanotaenia boesemani TaxID=1250792 RepID=UPI001C05ADE2|nr:interleukin-31 receptor subunit alpha-like isoform X2 [Melanotaenia boesemani]